MKRRLALLTAAALLTALALCVALPAHADALDEILNYTITVDVNSDGTLNMVYHIDWKVLDSDSEGPLTWVLIGIPNSHYESVRALSSNIESIYYASDSCCMHVDLDRAYYAGEVASFEFELVQDYMYEMNYLTEGETHYEFTPGWFDGIEVDELIIKWNSDKAISASPAYRLENGYYTWNTALDEGETYTVKVEYPNDAFGFDATKTIYTMDSDPDYNYSYNYSSGSRTSPVGGIIVLGLIVAAVLAIKKRINSAVYNSTANLSGGTKKITREKIVYYPECPGCGAPREEGKDNCAYCGKSLIKTKETVTEEQVPDEIKQKTTSGTYHYGADPNTFMRVHVVPIVVNRSSIFSSPSSSSRSGSCAHSSCACASHCACACACACAGGGRAGCSAKDFYNTGLRLETLERKCLGKK